VSKHTTKFSSDQTTSESIPYGYCQCGCGQKTKLSQHTDKRQNQIKGQPLRFVNGHNRRKTFPAPEIRYCECGCGQITPIAQTTNYTRKTTRGQRQRFIAGHAAKLRPLRPISERFWEKVNKAGPDECWEWQGARGPAGHGVFTIGSKRDKTRKTIPAHRFAYTLEHGTISDDKEACHKCDNPPCCNPAHIFAGTHRENMEDMVAKDRSARGERSGSTKLTDNDVIKIRQLIDCGMKQAEIGKLYSISQKAVSLIALRKRWKHI
jgi:hypothetical protein